MIELALINDDFLKVIWELGFSEKEPEWSKLDAPYFDEYESYKTYEEFYEKENKFFLSEDRRCILYNGSPVGIVNRYWEDKKTRWLAIGVVIYDSKMWRRGIGSQSLKLWIKETFNDFPELEHIGLTTWSENIGMMKCAEKIGMKKEAHIRKVRFYNNFYYDSLSYGILREEIATDF